MKNGINVNSTLVIMIAFICGCCNYYHVSTMFENDRHFSHLSTLEREMTFRTEMGLYYSYYKRIIRAQSFMSGLHSLVHDNKTEYPSTINTLQRFNLYPEVILGASYRIYMKLTDRLGIQAKECWQVDRGGGLPAVWSCEGLGDPSYFYINGVWMFAGTAAALIFLFGYFLSHSIIGGLLSVVCFFYNHGECTRVQWTPPLRESFGYPLILAQIFTVSWCLRQKVPHWKHLVYVSITTAASLVTWQFAQFVFLTQAIALLALWFLNPVPRPTVTVIFLGKLIGLQNAVLLLFANEMLMTSFYASTLATILGSILFIPTFSHRLDSAWKRVRYLIMHSVMVAVVSYALRMTISDILNSKDDAHIVNLLKAKLTSFRDFHTMLYVCAAEFDFLPLSAVYRLSSTLLLPCAYLSLGCVALLALGLPEKCAPAPKKQPNPLPSKKNRETRRENKEANQKSAVEVKEPIDPALVYNILQLAAFIAMAIMVMRLKLFMTPHFCILVSLLASRKFVFFLKSDLVLWALIAALVSGMSLAGIRNIKEQRNIIGEYSNPAFEDLINWIKREAPMDAAFAGPMPLMATILLTTDRPVVNHPHYEDVRLRERTKSVYKAFGRGSVAELYKTLVDMKVTYLVLQDHWCFGEPRPGCSMLDVWDIEEPGRKHLPPLCDQLFDGNSSPLQRVFSNEIYVVLRVPSHYVEVKLPPRQYRL